MNKKLIAVFTFATIMSFCFAHTTKVKTQKFEVEGHKSAVIHMTEIYRSDNWAEFYFVYEEDKNMFKEDAAEKVLYEFFSTYKRDHSYSSVHAEDLEGAKTVGKKTTMKKRVIFKYINQK